ncbi:class I SAM-dependent methyltransferase [Chloroflexota bacterium]
MKSMNNELDVTNITKNTYDQIATGYSDKIDNLVSDSWVGKYEQQLLDEFLRMIDTSNPDILDIGCGNGKDTAYLMKKGALVDSVDYSPNMLEEARKRVQNGRFHQMDMRKLKFPDEEFDGVWANGCIYHVPKSEINLVISEIIRVLKPSGILSFNAKEGIGERLEINPKSYGGGSRFYAYYNIKEMTKILEKSGFRIIKTENYPEEIFNEKIFHIWVHKS